MIRASRVWVLALAVVVAGCGSDPGAGGSPSPVPSSASASAGKVLPYGGAPKVANPLPVSVLSADPCATALTADQTKTIFGQVEAGQPTDKLVLGPTCEWANQDTLAAATVTYDSTHDGLSSVYQNTKPQSVVWRETSVQGFPAVAYVTDGFPTDEFCSFSVGIADSASVDVGITVSRSKVGKSDPCAVDAQIADMIIGNLKQKAGS